MGLPLALTFAALTAGLASVVSVRVRKARRARDALTPAEASEVPAAADPAFVDRLAEVTGMTFTSDNAVEVIRNSDGIIRRLFADIASARRSVTLQVYFARPGSVARELAAIVAERASTGVAVRILFDAIGCRGFDRTYFDDLRRNGVAVHRMRPIRWYAPHRITYRAHSRIAVIDGVVGYTGGFGIANAWRHDPDSADGWQDISVRFTGSTAHHAQVAFADAWRETAGEELQGPVFFPAQPLVEANHQAAFLRTAPCRGSMAAKPLVEWALSSARRSIYATTGYFAPDDNLMALLANAVRRGVDVRILTTGEATDLRIVRWAGRSTYGRLLRQGVRIYEYLPRMLHAKTMVVDGILSSVGAINFDRRSLEVNDETTLVVRDETIGSRLDAMFHRDLLDSREIEIAEFERRGWVERAYEELAAPIREQL